MHVTVTVEVENDPRTRYVEIKVTGESTNMTALKESTRVALAKAIAAVEAG